MVVCSVQPAHMVLSSAERSQAMVVMYGRCCAPKNGNICRTEQPVTLPNKGLQEYVVKFHEKAIRSYPSDPVARACQLSHFGFSGKKELETRATNQRPRHNQQVAEAANERTRCIAPLGCDWHVACLGGIPQRQRSG